MDRDVSGRFEVAQAVGREADDLLVGAGLLDIVRVCGPTRVGGSVALGLMVRREVDVYVQLPEARDTVAFLALGTALAQRFVVHKASYSNHFVRGLPGFDEGLFWGIRLEQGGNRWKLDLWGYGPERYRIAQAEFERLAADLERVDRGLILALKHAYLDGDGYRDGVTGAAIYAAVLAGVRDAGEFQAWLMKPTGPPRLTVACAHSGLEA